MKAYLFDGDNGETVQEEEIPADMVDDAQEKRQEMLEAVRCLMSR